MGPSAVPGGPDGTANLSSLKSKPIAIPPSLSARSSYTHTQAGPSTLIRTPSQSSFTSRNARLRHKRSHGPLAASLSHLDLPDHAATLAVLANTHAGGENEGGMAHSTRQTTYSSLPPSPRLQAAVDLGLRDTRVLQGLVGLEGLEEMLGGLSRKIGKDPPEWRQRERAQSISSETSEEGIHDDIDLEGEGADEAGHDRMDGMGKVGEVGETDGMDNEVDQVEEHFWPALSRRHTTEQPYMTGKGMHQAILESPTSATFGTSSGDEEKRGGGVKEEEEEGGIELGRVSSLWEILKDEAGEEAWEGWVADGKWERIANFLAVPLEVEKITMFGALLCLDGFLYNFTVLPLRALFAFYRLTMSYFRRQSTVIPPSHLHSILRLLLVIIPTGVLLVGTDASKMYHTVRGQDTIKLYVIFNALEIADRLCGAFGQDVLDTLFARETLSPSQRKRGKGRRRQQARPAFFFMLALGYVLAHSLIFFYMLVSLNVAINSYDYTLLSLLISNQFVEIKGSVFKKFEKENLFQIMCADIVERFQLGLMLTIIAIRNVIEMSGSDIAFLPKSFRRGKSLIESIFSPVLFVILSEMVVDWLKHAFITKFNHVRASVYGRFMDILAKDVLAAGSISSNKRTKRRGNPVLLDQSPLVARRLGFASIPLACLVLRVSVQAIGMLTLSPRNYFDTPASGDWGWTVLKWTGIVGGGLAGWACLVIIKIMLGLALLSYSAVRRGGMEEREREDRVNDFGRAPVGESKEETAYNKHTSEYLSKGEDLDIHPSPTSYIEPGEGYPTPRPGKGNNGTLDSTASIARPSGGGGGGTGGGKKGKKWKLEEVERWTMVKRIW